MRNSAAERDPIPPWGYLPNLNNLGQDKDVTNITYNRLIYKMILNIWVLYDEKPFPQRPVRPGYLEI